MSAEQKKELTGAERAAIFLITADEATAATIMQHLDAKDIKKISNSAVRIKDVSEDDLESVKFEFLKKTGKDSMLQVSQSGEIMKNLISKSLPKETADEITEYIETGLESSEGLDTLKWMDEETLYSFIKNEHPQTIALILAHLDPAQASKVLARLNEKLRSEIIVRIATLERISPNIVQEINQVLKTELLQSGTSKSSTVGGVESAAEILNFIDKAAEAQILSHIEEVNPTLSEKIRELMFVFDDLYALDDRSMQSILKEVSNDQLVLALKTASEEMKEKVFRNISERAATMIREEMEMMGPVKLSDVEQAQNGIVKIARKLEEEGKIQLSGKGGNDTLV